MIREAIKLLADFKDLPEEVMRSAMYEIMEGRAQPSQIAAFLISLRMKGETPQEITVGAQVLREKAVNINPNVPKLTDTCGTGGDGLHTFNISTLVALALSAYGIPVAKHGNRSVSSSCGSADLIEALGIPLDIDKDKTERAIKEVKFGFLFAPLYHPAMKYATPIRREIGIRTIFNILGPLANPAQPEYQILGVYDAKLLDVVIEALKNLNLKGALVVHAEDGMDEISICSRTEARILKDGKIDSLFIYPSEYGIGKADVGQLQVKNINENLDKVKKVLEGEPSPELDIVALNAGWALFILDEAKDPREGFVKIKRIFKEKKVKEKLEEIRNYFKNA